MFTFLTFDFVWAPSVQIIKWMKFFFNHSVGTQVINIFSKCMLLFKLIVYSRQPWNSGIMSYRKNVEWNISSGTVKTTSRIARFVEISWGPSGPTGPLCAPYGPMLAPWTLLTGIGWNTSCLWRTTIHIARHLPFQRNNGIGIFYWHI